MLGNVLNDSPVIKNDTPIPITDMNLHEWASHHFKKHETIKPMTVDSYIRASGLGKVCAREEVLAARYGIMREKLWTPDNNWTVNLGSGVHWAFQNLILGPAKLLTGMWRCSVCTHLHGTGGPIVIPDICESCGIKRSEFVCQVCRKPLNRNAEVFDTTRKMCNDCGNEAVPNDFEYVEVYLVDEELKIHGHCDGFATDEISLWEFKTANPFAMKKFKMGDIYPYYIEQAQFYLYVSDRKRMKFVFIDKGENDIRLAWVEKVINRSEQDIDAIKHKVTSLRNGLNGGEMPGRICGNMSCPRAKDCQLASICFDV